MRHQNRPDGAGVLGQHILLTQPRGQSGKVLVLVIGSRESTHGPNTKEQDRAEKNIPHESDVETRWGLIAVASSPWSTREGPKKELLVWVDFSVVFTIEIVLSPSIVLESLLSFSFHFFRPQLPKLCPGG